MVMVPHGAAQRNSRQFFLQQSFQRLIVLFLSLVDKVAGEQYKIQCFPLELTKAVLQIVPGVPNLPGHPLHEGAASSTGEVGIADMGKMQCFHRHSSLFLCFDCSKGKTRLQ